MKKTLSTFLSLILIFGFSACRVNPYDKDKDKDDDKDDIVVVDPEKPKPVDPDVEKPDPDVEKPKPIVPKPDPSDDKDYDETPVFVDGIRRYQPGVYLNHDIDLSADSGYKFVVVVVDDYGRISGVHIDESFQDDLYYQDANNNLYIRLRGNGDVRPSYRLITDDLDNRYFPTINDPITSYDLLEGVHDSTISKLKEVVVNETKWIAGEGLTVNDYIFKDQANLLSQRIINDNGTFGINLYQDEKTKEVKASNINKLEMPIGDYIELINEILYKEARLTNKSLLKDIKNPTYGLYKKGNYFNHSERYFDYNSKKTGYVYDFTYVSVDEFGSISGVYLDTTTTDLINANSNTTKNILGKNYGLTNSYLNQTTLLSQGVKENQNINFLEEKVVYSDLKYDFEPIFTDSISGVSINVNYLKKTIQEALDEAIFKDYKNGIYAHYTDDYNIFTSISNGKVTSINYDDFSFKETKKIDLTTDLSRNFDVFNLSLQFDDEEIVNHDVLELDKEIVENIYEAIFFLRKDKPFSTEEGYNFTNILSSGSYYAEDSIGGIKYYAYLNYHDDHIESLIFDFADRSNDSIYKNNSKLAEAYNEVASIIIDNQSLIIDIVTGGYDFRTTSSLISINNHPLFREVNEDVNMEAVDSLLKSLFAASANNKAAIDEGIITEEFNSLIESRPIIEGLNTIPLTLPSTTAPFESNEELSKKYRFEYVLDSDYIELRQANSAGFISLRLTDDVRRDTVETLKVKYRPEGSSASFFEFELDLPIYSLESADEVLYSNTNHPKNILEGETFDLDYKRLGADFIRYQDIKYHSDDSGITFDSSGRAKVFDETDELTYYAYIDLDQDDRMDNNEIIKEFKINVFEERDALEYIKNNATLGEVYDVATTDFIISKETGIYGTSLTYKVGPNFGDYLSIQKIDDKYDQVTVTRNKNDRDVYLQADVNGLADGINKLRFDFNVKARDLSSNYEYALYTVNQFDYSNLDLDKVVLGYDFQFDEILQNLKYFNHELDVKGNVFVDDVKVISSDFGKFINPYTGKVIRTTDSLDTDVNIEIKISASYPTRVASDSQEAIKIFKIRLITKEEIQTYLKKDIDEFKNLSFDISQNRNKNIEIKLPTKGISGVSNISYKFNGSNGGLFELKDDKLVVKTKTSSFVDNFDETYDLVITAEYGGYKENKTIKINVKE